MNSTNEPESSSFITQLRKVLIDGVDYAASVLALLQAQAAALALSSVTFLSLIFFAILAIIIAFVLLSVALGFWLAHLTGAVGWALLIMGGVYLLIALITGGLALKWLKGLKS